MLLYMSEFTQMNCILLFFMNLKSERQYKQITMKGLKSDAIELINRGIMGRKLVESGNIMRFECKSNFMNVFLTFILLREITFDF